MFRRHCFVGDWMAKNGQFEWIPFLDGDIGVVNPHREVEKFSANDNVELIFIGRIFNSEIADANRYQFYIYFYAPINDLIFRNTTFVRQFLNSWAIVVLPSIFHCSDNGLIHVSFLYQFYAKLTFLNI